MREITVDEIHDRVRSRYPAVEELPGRPQLDLLLESSGWSGRWSADEEAYLLKVGDAMSVASASRPSLHTYRPTRDAPAVPREVADARQFESDLRTTLENRRYLVLKTSMTELERAAGLLSSRFPELTMVDLDRELIQGMDEVLEARGIDPIKFQEAEAKGPQGRHWGRVTQVVAEAVEHLADRLAADTEPVCLHNIGLLAHFDALDLLQQLNGIAGGRADRACLVLIPGGSAGFALFDRAIPALPNQTSDVPDAWLRELHLRAEVN